MLRESVSHTDGKQSLESAGEECMIHSLESRECGVVLQALEDLHEAVFTNLMFGYAGGDEQEHVRVLLTSGSSGMCSSPSTRPDHVHIRMKRQGRSYDMSHVAFLNLI